MASYNGRNKLDGVSVMIGSLGYLLIFIALEYMSRVLDYYVLATED
jgi:hypothetical protein